MHSTLLRRAVVGPSPIAGVGLFTNEDVAPGEVVAALAGQCIDRAALDQMPAAEDTVRAIQIDDELFLLPGDEPAAAINHSCAPNTVLRGQVVVVALRPIAAGEEVTIDYATRNGSDIDEFECHCATANCRGKITGHDWMLPELQARYRGAFSPYLARRIGTLVESSASRRAFAY